MKQNKYDFNAQLDVESQNKPLVQLLFKNHWIDDISSEKSLRKLGTDFLLYPFQEGDEIRCENKFEQYASGRLTAEHISVDRPNVVPGWLHTSQAGFLFSWFPSGELIVTSFHTLRQHVMINAFDYLCTSTGNSRYLTWSTLIPIKNLLLEKDCYIVNYAKDLQLKTEYPPMVAPLFPRKVKSPDELVYWMKTLPPKTIPLTPDIEEIKKLIKKLSSKNLNKKSHSEEISELSWL